MQLYAQKLSDLVEQISSSSVAIETYMANNSGEIGAGFFVSPRVVVTCAHVVGLSPQNTNPNLKAIIVTLKSGERYYASVVDFDVNIDIAILYVNIPQTKRQYFLNLGNSGTISNGEAIISIGSPLGYTNTVSYGIVANSSIDPQKRFFLIDLRTNPGNSGGTIYSTDKQAVIGLAAAVLNSKEISSQGISVGIGIDSVKHLLRKNGIKFVYKEDIGE